MMNVEETNDGQVRVLMEDPPLAKSLFQSTGASVGWLLVRVWVGWQWFGSGTHQLTDRQSLSLSSQALEAYWRSALGTSPAGSGVVVDDWLRSVMGMLLARDAEYWIAGVIAVGEVVLGIALILGVFAGIMAAAGLLLQFLVFLIAGSSTANPFIVPLAILVILAWKNAGYVGFDRYLLRTFGAPWWDAGLRPRRGGTVAER